MADKLWQHIAASIEGTDAHLSYPQRICIAGSQLLAADSMSIALVVDGDYEPLSSSDDVARTMDEIQFSIGDGPSFSTQGGTDPILVEDLSHHDAVRQWPLFCDSAQTHHIAGLFCFPLRIGAANLGVMSAYRRSAATFTPTQFSYGLVLSSFAAAETVRSMAGDPHRDPRVQDPIAYDQSVVQFAAGMISERLNTSIVDALVRIRAHAFASDTTVIEVARLIASGRLVLDL